MATGIDTRLEEIETRYEAVQAEMAAPETSGDPGRLKQLGMAFAELEEIVTPYRAYREAASAAEDARDLAADEDPRRLEVILREAARIVRSRPPLVIAETRHGFVCASAGVDSSNAPEAGTVVLLPEDPDASAARLRERLLELAGAEVGVIVSDSFGRAWRQGTTDVAIGLAGIRPLLDLQGTRDRAGYELHATVIAVADELAGAAQLVMGKTAGVPAAVIRGVDASGRGTARDLVMPADRDLFR